MSDMTFASWTQPIADRLEQSKRGVEEVVSQIPPDNWEKPSGYARWSFKDQLSHLGDSHARVQVVLRAILQGRDPDFSQFLRIDEINEEDRHKHSASPVEELRSAYAERSQETLRVVSELTAEHAAFSLGPMTLDQALQGFAMHDMAHLEELKKALQG